MRLCYQSLLTGTFKQENNHANEQQELEKSRVAKKLSAGDRPINPGLNAIQCDEGCRLVKVRVISFACPSK